MLRPGDPPLGPAGRAALAYVLEVEGRPVQVYAANVETVLRRFVDRAVVATGKLVDLSGEGLGEELWLAFIRDATAEE